MPIQLLPPRLANQIAAGEVVERPASVVKELVENSLDAGATKIELDIEKGGHKRIRLRDNGCGIPQHELELALSRHATSKISTLEDLERILSLGFRGEALASISSVSRLTLSSKPAEQQQAWQAHCEGRDMAVKLNPVAHPDGTTIDVADLFYNTPARRKFLRTEKTEFQHIDDVIRRIALSHPEVTFVLRHNGKAVRRFLAVEKQDRAARIGAVAGQKFLNNAIYCRTEYDGIEIEGWLGNENVLRSSTDCQFSFVNGRGMRDKLILHAIRQAYESAWGIMEQPAFVVYLTVPPADVDVNVHPAKHEVRFQQSRLVHDFICKTVTDALTPQSHSDAITTRVPPPAEHDYIRPLVVATPAEAVTERQPSPAYSAPPTPHLNSARGHSPSRGHTGSARKGNDSQYQTNYQQLMTPNGDTASAASPLVDAIALDSKRRLFSDSNNAYLLHASRLAAIWIEDLIGSASTSQPLLMPVSVSAENVTTETIDALNGASFVVTRAAGKCRLQQVPAGTRHLPWLAVFGPLLEHPIQSINDIPALLGNLIVAQDDSAAQPVWQWFDAQSTAKRWEWIHEFGTVRPLSALIACMEQTDG
ncbi:DNA mismatch repair endonuclease MutL [Alteromonas sp. H39]|uniref:DNA mismatch repair endonuclease MutL n=1 Tax=Alteromonas sp. H39 TaxID=3389876 RepID=UPI0039DF83BC